jgi:hypothetical protein
LLVVCAFSSVEASIMTTRVKKIVDYSEEYAGPLGNVQTTGFITQLFKMVNRGPANMISVRGRRIVHRSSCSVLGLVALRLLTTHELSKRFQKDTRTDSLITSFSLLSVADESSQGNRG